MTIERNMGVYKNKEEKRPVIKFESKIPKDKINESSMYMNVHSGTHIDAAFHVDNAGDTIDSIDLTKLITANVSKLTEIFTPSLANFWVLFLKPPINMLSPNTNNTFPIIEPAIDALTISNKPALKAKNDKISSVTLPNVALKNPPSLAPVYFDNSSVAAPSNAAKGTIARAVIKNCTLGPPICIK